MSNRENNIFNILPIPREYIEHLDISRKELGEDLKSIAAAWISERKVRKVTLTISGYDDDPRELYEIPEVCAWAKDTYEHLASLCFFLDNESLVRFIGWLCGPVSREDIESPQFLKIFDDTTVKCSVDMTIAASDFLKKAGASEDLLSTFILQKMNNK
ncbi:hypothetical protein ACFLYN_05635 [Chloroflexota bacterium]